MSEVLFQDDVKKLKEYLGVHPEDINILNECNRTPLVHSIFEERMGIVDTLIDLGCDINFQDKSGFSALHYCCYCHNIDRNILEKVINSGANGLLKTEDDYIALHSLSISNIPSSGFLG